MARKRKEAAPVAPFLKHLLEDEAEEPGQP
jgi:hypothetical protein